MKIILSIFLLSLVSLCPLFGKEVEIIKIKRKDATKGLEQNFTIKAKDLKAAVYKGKDGKKLPYRLFKPKNTGKGPYPMLVFLHGIGEKGKDNLRQLKHEQPLIFVQPDVQQKHPCYFLAPQHAGNEKLDGLFYETVSASHSKNG